MQPRDEPVKFSAFIQNAHRALVLVQLLEAQRGGEMIGVLNARLAQDNRLIRFFEDVGLEMRKTLFNGKLRLRENPRL